VNSGPSNITERERGAALVVTLLVCTVLATVVVALMQNTGLDRASSAGIANQYRAKLAAEAGLAQFQADLAQLVATNDFVLVALTNGLTNIVSIVQPQTNGEVRVYPLVSRSNSITPLVASAPFNSTNLFTAASGISGATNLNPTLARYGGTDWPATNDDALILNAQFVVSATNTNGSPAAQFAYVVSDDCAKINLAIAGTSYAPTGRTNPLPSAFPGEVAVFGAGANSLAAGDYDKFEDLPSSLRSGIVLPSVFASTNERKAMSRFYSTHQGQAFDLIPAGYFDDSRTVFKVHADAGKFKYDLNRMATNSADSRSNAFAIADVIASNLPSFRLRDPSFTNSEAQFRPSDPDFRYARRIAAAIVDYIDADSNPTTITDGEPAGKEAMAYPFQIAERYDWVSTASAGSAESWIITVRQKVFVELWNPYTVPVSGDLKFELETFRQIEPPGGAFVDIPKLSKSIPVSLQPNEIKVYELGEQSIVFNVTGSNPSSNPSASPLRLQGTHSIDINKPEHSSFKAFWDEDLYDQTSSYNTALFDERASGLEKTERVMTNANRADRPVWAVNTGRTVYISSTGTYRSVNDPRQNHINNYVWANPSYTSTNTRWNGANNWPATSEANHKLESTWAARDGFRAALNVGGTAAANTDPTAVASTYNPATHSNNAPAFVRNQPMETVAELGHIYDPVHLDDAGANVSGGDPASRYAAGGGRTLRVGQPEPTDHVTLNRGGHRAMNLLDIFTARPPATTANAPRAAGLNINTAPADVLAAFFFNLQPVSDRGLAPISVISLEGATNIATNIVANRPYYSASDMHLFLNELANTRSNFTPSIAGVLALDGEETPTPNMHDRAREELFRRAYNSLDIKSGALRYYGVGRTLDQAGNVLSTAVLEAWVELRAATNNAGRVYLRPVVTQRKFL
jgi:type II secretory pathway component PulK